MATIQEGVRGGVSLIDDSDRGRIDSELDEKDNVRSGDRLDEVINTITNGGFKGRVDRRMFSYTVNGVTRAQDITYDREYIGFKLLIDFFSLASKNTTMREEVHAEIARKEKFASERGYKYLPIIESQFDVSKLKGLLA